MNKLEAVTNASYGNLAYLEPVESLRECDGSFEGEKSKVRLLHRETVVDSDQDLVVSLGGECTSKPYFVVSVVRCDKGNHFFHVQALACLEVTL